MKNLFRLGMIAFIAISIASCSKSSMDLLPNDEAATTTGTQTPGTQNTGTQNRTTARVSPLIHIIAIPDGTEGQQSYIYPVIYQPHQLKLGYSKRSVMHSGNGDYAVFYVIVSPEHMPDPSNKSTLTLVDSKTNEALLSTDLISYEEASQYEIGVPQELTGQVYMFAQIKMGDLENHADKVITLHSEINITPDNGKTNESWLAKAFILER
ncbi:MAG: hypothetical protein HOP10_15760 [Chitinophagaceae bacterium]|nr:hypothetical protein [Chitinophagaceae bacterium]